MKKSKLYKLVQESLKEVIQEQTRTAPTADALPDSPAGDFADPQTTQGLTPDVAVGTADVPFKITGRFILGGMASDF